MELGAYLRRIGFAGEVRPDLATLRAIHRAHLLSIPYENLDVQLGRPVGTDPAAAYDKIVRRGRGGWCYEMNGLLGWALGEIGFSVTRLCGAVMRQAAGDAVIGNHLVLRVDLDGPWIADAGFGDGPLEPFRLQEGAFRQRSFDFRLERQDAAWWRLHNHPHGGAASYDVTLAPAEEPVLAERCRWLQTAPESNFVLNAVVQRHDAEGLWLLRGRVLRRLDAAGPSDRLLASAAEYVEVLGSTFGLQLPEAADLWPRICARHAALFEDALAAEPDAAGA